MIHSAVEEFAGELTAVIRRFLKTPSLAGTRSASSSAAGFRASRVGELAIGRTEIMLKADGQPIEIELIRNHPDEAGLIGAAHLMPSWMLEGFDGILAVDIGGTNIRAGVVETNLKKSAELAKAKVWKSELWRHGDEKTKRDEAVERLIDMLKDLIKECSKAKLSLAPVVGIGCPGRIREDGSIETGAQNLPGNWESSRFNLSDCIRARDQRDRQARNRRRHSQRRRRAGPQRAAGHGRVSSDGARSRSAPGSAMRALPTGARSRRKARPRAARSRCGVLAAMLGCEC